jgi:hypothetical protein
MELTLLNIGSRFRHKCTLGSVITVMNGGEVIQRWKSDVSTRGFSHSDLRRNILVSRPSAPVIGSSGDVLVHLKWRDKWKFPFTFVVQARSISALVTTTHHRAK